jgi:hypothetical protein
MCLNAAKLLQLAFAQFRALFTFLNKAPDPHLDCPRSGEQEDTLLAR